MPRTCHFSPQRCSDQSNPHLSKANPTTITIPNPDLKPERSDKISAQLEYYFEPAGTLSLHVFETNINGAVDDGTVSDSPTP